MISEVLIATNYKVLLGDEVMSIQNQTWMF